MPVYPSLDSVVDALRVVAEALLGDEDRLDRELFVHATSVVDDATTRPSRRIWIDTGCTPGSSRSSSPDGAGSWMSDWEFWVDGVVVPFDTENVDLKAHGIDAVDVLANELSARRAVHGRQAGQIQVESTNQSPFVRSR